MPSSADEVDAAIEGAVARVRADVARHDSTPGAGPVVILIDGQSGAGKSTLASRLAAAWQGDVNVVALDDVYPGWDGLEVGADTARAQILEPWCAGRTARWHRWDWARSAPGDEMTTAAGVPLIIEGSGVLTEVSAALAPIRVWLESPAGTRRERALARDGETYRPHWDRWADQERRHLDRDRPRDLATLVVEIP